MRCRGKSTINDIRKSTFFMLVFVSTAILLGIYIHFGRTKIGYHIDEIFTYISSNSEVGYDATNELQDNVWYSGEFFSSAMSVSPNYRFNYVIPYKNQVGDVHPPIYYMLLHTICSFFPGMFSKWFGISLNIGLTLLSLVVLYYLIRYFIGGSFLPLILSFMFGATYGIINNCIFVRMYVLVMLFVTLQFYYHLLLYSTLDRGADKFSIRQILGLILVTITGTLSQYYFLIFLFGLALLLGIYMLVKRKMIAVIQYIGAMVVSGASCLLIFPAMWNHIFHGGRVSGSLELLTDIKEKLNNIKVMFGILSMRLANGHLFLLLNLMIVWLIVMVVCKKVCIRQLSKIIILSLPTVLYFIVVSEISPFLTDRYITPIYGVVYALVAVSVVYLFRTSFGTMNVKLVKNCAAVILILAGAVLTIHRLDQDVVQSRYWLNDRYESILKYANAGNSVCIYVSGNGNSWKLWNEFPFMMQFEKVYYIDGQSLNHIADQNIAGMNDILVYLDDKMEVETVRKFFKQELGKENLELLFESDYADGYLLR